MLNGLQVSFSLARSQSIIAHLAFEAARIPSVATRYNAFFENLVKYSLMKSDFLLRGE